MFDRVSDDVTTYSFPVNFLYANRLDFPELKAKELPVKFPNKGDITSTNNLFLPSISQV